MNHAKSQSVNKLSFMKHGLHTEQQDHDYNPIRVTGSAVTKIWINEIFYKCKKTRQADPYGTKKKEKVNKLKNEYNFVPDISVYTRS